MVLMSLLLKNIGPEEVWRTKDQLINLFKFLFFLGNPTDLWIWKDKKELSFFYFISEVRELGF